MISPESTSDSWSPSIVSDSSNNIHVVWPDSTDYNDAGTDQDIFYKMWNFSSSSWINTQIISVTSSSYSDHSSIAIDSSDNVHVVWKDYFLHDAIVHRYWDSTSLSWSSTEIISTESTSTIYNPSLAIDSSDNLHVVWPDKSNIAGSGTDADIVYKCWNSSSHSWGITEELTTETYFSASPALAIESADNLHLAWRDYSSFGSSGADSDIYYKNLITDSDRDGMPDKWEEENGLNSTRDDSNEDPDEDGLTNLEEYQYNTNPQVADTDGDGFSDKEEVDGGTDPLNPDDYPTEDNTFVVSFLPIAPIIVLVRMGIKRRNDKRPR